MITREQIKLFLQNIASSHYNIHTFGWGDVPDLLARENVIYPYMMVTPVPSTFEDGYINYGYLVSIADRIREGNQNEVEVDRDTFNIMMQVITQIDNLLYNDVDLVKGQTITPFMEAHRHRVSGHFSELQIRVKYNYDACAIPSDEVPLPLPPPPSCAVANYRVEYENGTLIEAGTIPSGGSKTIEVPDPSICANATWELKDEDGNLLDSGSVASGGSVTIEAPNADLLIRNSLNQTLYNLSLLSGSSGTQTIGDSSIRLEDSVGTLIANSSVVAEGSATIAAPNGVVSVRKSDGVEIYSVDVRSNGTASQNVADSVIENSDASYTANVKATDPLVLPDSQINVNSVDSGDVVSVKTIDVNITDGVDPVTPTNVTLTGNTLEIEVPSGGGSYDIDTTDRFGNVLPTIIVSANTTLNWKSYDYADFLMTQYTGTYTSGEELAIFDAIDDWVTAGIWEKRVCTFLFTGKNATDNSLNAKYPFLDQNSGVMSFLGSPTHDSNGVTFGATSAAFVNINRSQLKSQNFNVFIYSRTNNLPTSDASDFIFTGNPVSFMNIRDNNANRVGLSDGGQFGYTSSVNSDSTGGYHANFINGTNASLMVKNGLTGSPLRTLTAGTNINNYQRIGLGGQVNLNNSVQFTTSRNYAGFAFGDALTNTQMQDDYDIWQQFQTDFNGRQL